MMTEKIVSDVMGFLTRAGLMSGHSRELVRDALKKIVSDDLSGAVPKDVPCTRLADCSCVRMEGKCRGPSCGVYDPVKGAPKRGLIDLPKKDYEALRGINSGLEKRYRDFTDEGNCIKCGDDTDTYFADADVSGERMRVLICDCCGSAMPLYKLDS